MSKLEPSNERERNVPLKVTSASMQESDNEEHGIEVGYNASSANDSTPRQTHCPVSNVVRLAAILPPAAGEKAIAAKRLITKNLKM